jgi:membrane protein DedA with SNARE-associated domain
MTHERITYAEEKLKKNSRKVMFVARFLAGLRAPIYLTAGILGVRPAIFITLDFLAALISVPALVYVGHYFGEEIDLALLYARRAERYILLVLAAIGVWAIIRSILNRKRNNM